MEVNFRNEKAAAAYFKKNLEGSFDRAHFGFAGKYLEEHDAYLYVEFIFRGSYLQIDNSYDYEYALNNWVYPYESHNRFIHLNEQFSRNKSGELNPNGCISNLDLIANDALEVFVEEFKRKMPRSNG